MSVSSQTGVRPKRSAIELELKLRAICLCWFAKALSSSGCGASPASTLETCTINPPTPSVVLGL